MLKFFDVDMLFEEILRDAGIFERALLLQNLSDFLSACSTLRAVAILIAVLAAGIALPLFLLLKLTSTTYSTHTFQYGWTISGAYLSGLVPAIMVLLLWYSTVLLIGYCTSIRKISWRSSIAGKPVDLHSESEHSRSLIVVVGYRLLVFSFNLLVVVLLNGSYVYLELTQTGTIKALAIVATAFFKLGWNGFVVSWLNRAWKRRDGVVIASSSSLMHFFMILINNIVAPCGVIVATDPSCLREYLIAPEQQTSSYAYQQCVGWQYFASVEDPCVDSGSVTANTAFSPPFVYSSQCSSALLVNYVPVFALQYTVLGIILPALYGLLWMFDRSQYASGSSITAVLYSVVRGLVPRLLTRDFDRTKSILLPARQMIFTFIGGCAVMLTFGIAYPPLAFIIALYICTNIHMWTAAIHEQVLEKRKFDVPNADRSAYADDTAPTETAAVSFLRDLNEDCSNANWREVTNGFMSLLLLLCCSFYSILFMDWVANKSAYFVLLSLLVAAPISWAVVQLYDSANSTITARYSRALQRPLKDHDEALFDGTDSSM